MKRSLFFCTCCLLLLPLYSVFINTKALLDKKFIQNVLTKEAAWSDSHQAQGDYLGCGMLYFSLVYMKKAKVCVCLGSGGGFVPRVMKQAQRELGFEGARTILVDGNMGRWGRPKWLARNSFFQKHYPDVELKIDTTHNVAMKWDKNVMIDYLHIDADHSFEGSLQDFRDFLPLMSPNGIITLHDTNGDLPCHETAKVIAEEGYEVVNFEECGAGVAIIHISGKK